MMNAETMLTRFNQWRRKRRIARIERAFQNACYDFLILRNWTPNAAKPGRWINYVKHANGVTTLDCTFRDALNRTLEEAKTKLNHGHE